jgi:hypothetical protein
VAPLLQRLADVGGGDAVENDAPAAGDLRQDIRHQADIADHLPQVPLDIDVLQLRHGVPGDHLDHLAGRVRDEMHDDRLARPLFSRLGGFVRHR